MTSRVRWRHAGIIPSRAAKEKIPTNECVQKLGREVKVDKKNENTRHDEGAPTYMCTGDVGAARTLAQPEAGCYIWKKKIMPRCVSVCALPGSECCFLLLLLLHKVCVIARQLYRFVLESCAQDTIKNDAARSERSTFNILNLFLCPRPGGECSNK